MSRGRVTPWPAYVDLFGGFAVATLGLAFVMSTHYEKVRKERDDLLQERSEPQRLAQELYREIVEGGLAGVSAYRCSEEDVCVDVSVMFKTDSDVLSENDKALIYRVARALRPRLDGGTEASGIPRSGYLQVVVEGHTDDRQNVQAADLRTRFKHNWDLSARRASSVLHELRQSGLGTDHYNLVSWGRADSAPKCRENTDECRQVNRRTTIRLRFDYESYAILKKAIQPSEIAIPNQGPTATPAQ